MAIYNRTNSTPTATAATVPSMDLGSIIVTSLQNAVESMQNEDKDTTLKDTIRQGIEDSAVIKAIQASSAKLSNLFSNKSNTEAKKTKETPADKVMSTGLEKLLKANTDAKKDKETPAEKMEKEMSELLQITKDDKKKQKANESKVVQEKKKEKEHKTTIKEGFSAVKAFGATIMNKIGLIILGVAVIAELFVFLKYTYHYLMGVWIPNTWTKIKLAWTGFWTKIITQIKNFFVEFYNKTFGKFLGIPMGLDEEGYQRLAELAEKFSTGAAKTAKDAVVEYSKKKEEISTSVGNAEKLVGGMSFFDSQATSLQIDIESKFSQLQAAIENGGEGMTSILSGKNGQAGLKTQIESLQNRLNAIGDSGNASKLDSILYYLNELDSTELKTLNTRTKNAIAAAGPNFKSELEEYNMLLHGQVDPEKAAERAQIALMENEYNKGNLSVMESETLKADKKYGDIVKAAYENVGGEAFNKYEQDDKHEQWLKTYGKEWVDTFRDMTNHLTQNIGVNVSIPENTYPFGVKMD